MGVFPPPSSILAYTKVENTYQSIINHSLTGISWKLCVLNVWKFNREQHIRQSVQLVSKTRNLIRLGYQLFTHMHQKLQIRNDVKKSSNPDHLTIVLISWKCIKSISMALPWTWWLNFPLFQNYSFIGKMVHSLLVIPVFYLHTY